MLEIWRIIQVCVVMSFSETDATKRVGEQNLPSITQLFQWWNPSSSKTFVFLPRKMLEIWRVDHVSVDKASNQALDSPSLMTSIEYTRRWLGFQGNLLHPFNCLRKLYNSKPLFCAVRVLLEQASQELDLLHHHTHQIWLSSLEQWTPMIAFHLRFILRESELFNASSW